MTNPKEILKNAKDNEKEFKDKFIDFIRKQEKEGTCANCSSDI